jgi:hypothetical protein
MIHSITDPVEVRPPCAGEWFRVKPGDERRASTLALRDAGTGCVYLLPRELWPALGATLVPVCLRAWTNLTGRLAVWPIGLPTLEGGPELTLGPTCVVAELAEMKWCRLRNALHGQGVILSTQREGLPEPEWPDVSFIDIVELAFRDRLITSLDHPVIHQGGAR